MRQAQHAHTPRTAAAASFNRAGGGKAGGGRGAAAAESGRSGAGGGHPKRSPYSRFAGLKESTSFSVVTRPGGKWGPGSGFKVGGGGRRGDGTGGGGKSGDGGGSSSKNLTGMALRTLFGGVSGRMSTSMS